MTKDFWSKLGNTVGGRQDPFEVRYGPSPNCFSSNDIVRMFRLGATTRDVDHLNACSACLERIKRFFSLATGSEMLHLDAYPGLKQILASGARLALLHIPSAIPVSTGSNLIEPFSIKMTTGLESKCEGLNLELAGPIQAKATCSMAASEKVGWAEVVFQKPHISSNALKEIQRHGRFTDQILLRAGNSKNETQIVGTSNIELQAKP